MDRRRFLKTGLICATTLATGATLYGCSDLKVLDTELIDDDVEVALAALLPVFLNGVLPSEPELRKATLKSTIDGMRTAIKRFPPHIHDELNDLFGLLTSKIANLAYAGSLAQMNELSMAQKTQLIEGWRNSYISLMNTAYDGLRELVFAAYYGNENNWEILNYQKPNIGV